MELISASDAVMNKVPTQDQASVCVFFVSFAISGPEVYYLQDQKSKAHPPASRAWLLLLRCVSIISRHVNDHHLQ